MEGGTRRGLSGILVLGLALLGSAGPSTQSGTFALLGGTQKITSQFWAESQGGQSYSLHVRQYTLKKDKPIMNYDIDMQKTMHMVVIRDDFATFEHLHPGFSITDGSFIAHFSKAPNHKYYVYADSIPQGKGQQVFRFTMDSDGPAATPNVTITPSSPTQPAGPYTVTLQNTTIAANSPTMMYVYVKRNGQPAQDLTPYLGAAAHCVMINTASLAYVHVHPLLRGEKEMPTGHGANLNTMGEMQSESKVGPNMQMQFPALAPGTYKVWFQFKGGGSQHTYAAAFTLNAQ